MPSYECYTEYELNGLLCSTPAQQQRNDGITIPSQAAYVYDFPYYPGASPHEEGVNCGYLDGHAAWLPFDEMGLDGPEGDRFYRKGHQY
jgi:prepilin-type processing-associated H-X9-DG protein